MPVTYWAAREAHENIEGQHTDLNADSKQYVLPGTQQRRRPPPAESGALTPFKTLGFVHGATGSLSSLAVAPLCGEA